MTKKRRNNGRSKHGRGRTPLVTCESCARRGPSDKLLKRTLVEKLAIGTTALEIKENSVYEGYVVPTTVRTVYFCISCSVHKKFVCPRSKEDRKDRRPDVLKSREEKLFKVTKEQKHVGNHGYVEYKDEPKEIESSDHHAKMKKWKTVAAKRQNN